VSGPGLAPSACTMLCLKRGPSMVMNEHTGALTNRNKPHRTAHQAEHCARTRRQPRTTHLPIHPSPYSLTHSLTHHSPTHSPTTHSEAIGESVKAQYPDIDQEGWTQKDDNGDVMVYAGDIFQVCVVLCVVRCVLCVCARACAIISLYHIA
jgi:hypothetical protein